MKSGRAGRFSKVAVVVLGVALIAVATSGLWLSFRYQPGGSWVEDLHVAAGWISVIAAAAIAVGLIVQSARKWAGWVPAAAMSLVFVSTLVAAFSGRRLPWLGLGVRQVIVAGTYRGVWSIGSDAVFVSIPGGEIDPGRYRMWLVLHVVIVPICLAAAVLAIVASRRARDRRTADAALAEARPPHVVEIVLGREPVVDDSL